MRTEDISQRVTTLVTEHRDVLESITATGNSMERALAETFLEIAGVQA